MKPPKSSRIDQRIAEIERDLKRVQKTMRAARDGRLPPAPMEHAPFAAAPPTYPQTEPPAESPAPVRAAPLFGPSTPDAEPDLFSHGLRSVEDAARDSTAAGRRLDSGHERQRFASYLSSGGLMGIQPLRRERSYQRARAIFMIAVVLLATYIFYWLLF
ncbi:MAG: hypothetical protein U1E27_10780 [Kiritimatiellia bacterium]|nr:hypothetical protein [Kiritimatiellia bacterium]